MLMKSEHVHAAKKIASRTENNKTNDSSRSSKLVVGGSRFTHALITGPSLRRG